MKFKYHFQASDSREVFVVSISTYQNSRIEKFSKILQNQYTMKFHDCYHPSGEAFVLPVSTHLNAKRIVDMGLPMTNDPISIIITRLEFAMVKRIQSVTDCRRDCYPYLSK